MDIDSKKLDYVLSQYRTNYNKIQFENEISIWLNQVSNWWDNEIKKADEWNRIITKLENSDLFKIDIPKPYIPDIQTITNIFESKLNKETSKILIQAILGQMHELAHIISRQLISYQNICDQFFEEKIQDTEKEFQLLINQFGELLQRDTENPKHSIDQDVDLFSTTEGKLDFLQCYVSKYENEFVFNPSLFNKLSFELSEKLSQDEVSDEDSEYKPINVPLPPKKKWIEIPIKKN